MTIDNIEILCQANVRDSIESNIDRSSDAVALDKHIEHAALVATQVKYLGRAKSKLPSYYAARCIIPPLSFEQSSSEAVAATKTIEGESILDLTCGLGVDALHFSKHFRRVVTIERDEVLARVATENFKRLGATNIEVVCAPSEEYLPECQNHFDWIYADPDRRSSTGKKLVRLEDCSPNILDLLPDIHRISGRLMVKNSPLFDVDEAFRLFSPSRVEVLSLGDECKEVLLSTGEERDTLIATALGRGSLSLPRSEVDNSPSTNEFEPEKYKYLIIPDVALQKARLVCHALKSQAHVWSNNGFGFSWQRPEGFVGRTEEIEKIVEYSPKTLKRELSGQGIEILKREFPYSTTQIVKQLKIKEGGRKRLAFTRVSDRSIVIFLK